jgi:hypothetical protein
MAIVRNAIRAMEKTMSPEQVQKARVAADREVLSIELSKLRESQGIKQSEFSSFTQTAISKLEKRRDMKLSTLIEYLSQIGMGIEILVYRKAARGRGRKQTLLRA